MEGPENRLTWNLHSPERPQGPSPQTLKKTAKSKTAKALSSRGRRRAVRAVAGNQQDVKSALTQKQGRTGKGIQLRSKYAVVKQRLKESQTSW